MFAFSNCSVLFKYINSPIVPPHSPLPSEYYCTVLYCTVVKLYSYVLHCVVLHCTVVVQLYSYVQTCSQTDCDDMVTDSGSLCNPTIQENACICTVVHFVQVVQMRTAKPLRGEGASLVRGVNTIMVQ